MEVTLRQIARRAARSVRRHGMTGTIRLSVRQVLYDIQNRRHPDHQTARQRLRQERQFDSNHNVETAGRLVPTTLQSMGNNLRYACGYAGTIPDLFDGMISGLPVSVESWTFLDIGSGKGKALLLASQYPFRRIIGVEFCQELHQAALRNIQTCRGLHQRCREISSHLADATTFPIPDERLVCYFYNPFSAEVMAKVLGNIGRSLQQHPRDLFIVYHTPVAASLMDEAEFLTFVSAGEAYRIYRSRCGATGR